MGDLNEIELVFELQKDGGYHVYAPDLAGLHTQGSDFNDAMANAREAIGLYVEGLRENGRSIDMGGVRRRVSLLAWARPGGDGSADG